MQVHQDVDVHLYAIKSHSDAGVVVQIPRLADQLNDTDGGQTEAVRRSEATLTRSFIISASSLEQDWPVEEIGQLNETAIEQLLIPGPELIIIGTGKQLVWPPRSLMAPLINAGIGYEIMNTAAACRTYNVLSYEGRRVVAGLIL